MHVSTSSKRLALAAGAAVLSATGSASAAIGTFTGADAGEGLDLQGNIIYAIDPGGTAAVGTVGNANFASDDALPAGVTLTSDNEINPGGWGDAEYGAIPPATSTTDDERLETIMESIRWENTGDGGTLNVDLAVTAGQTYQLQLLFAESCCGNRFFDVRVEGTTIHDDFTTASAFNNFNPNAPATTTGTVITHTLLAGDGTINVILDGAAAAGAGRDTNPILNGLTLELIPEPTSLAIVGVTAVGMLGRRRTRR